MEIAEKLYLEGYISYPRTETDSYGSKFDFHNILEKLKENKEYCEFLQKSPFSPPKGGKKNDEAHPPIHPVKNYNKDPNSREQRVFDFIARSFMASCAKDAELDQIEVQVEIQGEQFSGKGVKVREANFLEIYGKFAKVDEKDIPNFEEGELLAFPKLTMAEGKTSPPKLLTESDLISLMDSNGIGTDATIHQHIETIQKRNYVEKRNSLFYPTQLGMALLSTYEDLKTTLADPFQRAKTEEQLSQIAKGKANREEVLRENIEKMLTDYKIL